MTQLAMYLLCKDEDSSSIPSSYVKRGARSTHPVISVMEKWRHGFPQLLASQPSWSSGSLGFSERLLSPLPSPQSGTDWRRHVHTHRCKHNTRCHTHSPLFYSACYGQYLEHLPCGQDLAVDRNIRYLWRPLLLSLWLFLMYCSWASATILIRPWLGEWLTRRQEWYVSADSCCFFFFFSAMNEQELQLGRNTWSMRCKRPYSLVSQCWGLNPGSCVC